MFFINNASSFLNNDYEILTMFSSPEQIKCLTYDSNNVLYIAGDGYIAKYVNYNIILIAGDTNQGDSPDGIDALSSQISSIRDMAFDTFGNLIFADAFNYKIKEISVVDNKIYTIAGIGENGFPRDGFDAINEKIGLPYGLVVDKTNNIYFSDTLNSTIHKIDTDGKIFKIAGILGETGFTSSKLNRPKQIYLDKDEEYILVADSLNFAIREVDLNSFFITTLVGNGKEGNTISGSRPLRSPLEFVVSVTLDLDDNVIIGQKDKISKVNIKKDIITNIAGNDLNNIEEGGVVTDIGFITRMVTNSSGDIVFCDISKKVIEKLIK